MIVQGSPEWFAARLGKVTASRVADVIAKTKSGPSASRANYAAELIVERLTGQRGEGFTNAAMQWGTDNEPAAREAYEFATGTWVDQVGFIVHPRIAESGASPDGLIGADGMLEIKAPNTATHLETLTSQKIPPKYQTQMAWQLACAGRRYCDFVSFDPRLPAHLQLFIKRYERDDALIEDLEADVIAFLTEVDAKLADLARIYGGPDVAVAA
jgi:putative phage-type endonuclease